MDLDMLVRGNLDELFHLRWGTQLEAVSEWKKVRRVFFPEVGVLFVVLFQCKHTSECYMVCLINKPKCNILLYDVIWRFTNTIYVTTYSLILRFGPASFRLYNTKIELKASYLGRNFTIYGNGKYLSLDYSEIQNKTGACPLGLPVFTYLATKNNPIFDPTWPSTAPGQVPPQLWSAARVANSPNMVKIMSRRTETFQWTGRNFFCFFRRVTNFWPVLKTKCGFDLFWIRILFIHFKLFQNWIDTSLLKNNCIWAPLSSCSFPSHLYHLHLRYYIAFLVLYLPVEVPVLMVFVHSVSNLPTIGAF